MARNLPSMRGLSMALKPDVNRIATIATIAQKPGVHIITTIAAIAAIAQICAVPRQTIYTRKYSCEGYFPTFIKKQIHQLFFVPDIMAVFRQYNLYTYLVEYMLTGYFPTKSMWQNSDHQQCYE